MPLQKVADTALPAVQLGGLRNAGLAVDLSRAGLDKLKHRRHLSLEAERLDRQAAGIEARIRMLPRNSNGRRKKQQRAELLRARAAAMRKG